MEFWLGVAVGAAGLGIIGLVVLAFYTHSFLRDWWR